MAIARKTKKVRVSAEKLLGKKNPKKKDTVNSEDIKPEKIPSLKGKKWYVLSTQTGHEFSVAKAIKQRVEATNVGKIIGDVLVPTRKKIVVKGGKQNVIDEKYLPGYVLVEMVLNEKTWELITNTEGVTGFVRTDKYPRPLPENEVKAIMKYMEVEQPEYKVSFSVGDAVKVIDGAFADFIGSVQELDETKGKVKVLISFLGREAPVELDFSQVSKL